MFEHALAAAGVAADEAVHVGDHPEHDVLAARSAGLRAVWANPLALPRPAAVPRDVPTLADFADLERIVGELAGADDGDA
jgi:putative hydrolase of the HAD superfamily